MKILLVANTDWYLYNFRRVLAGTLKDRGHDVCLASPKGEYVRRLEALGLPWQELPFHRSGTNPFEELLTLVRMWRLYRRERPDLVHHFTIKPVLYGSIAALLAGVPCIINSVTGLGYVFTGRAGGLRLLVSLLYRMVLGRSWAIFENPDDRAAFLEQKLVRPERVYLVHGAGADTDLYQMMPEPEGTPVIILPARLLWDKGVGEFVEAAGILKRRGVAARFVLAGDTDRGNPSAVPQEYIQETQKQNLVEWWGWQDNMLEVYRQANIVCLPSYREGLPTCLIEAAACGRAIVTTDVPGCREIVRQGESGLLVPVRDAAALAGALQTLIEDPTLRQKMAENGHRIAVTGFDVRQVVKDILELYDRALTSLQGSV